MWRTIPNYYIFQNFRLKGFNFRYIGAGRKIFAADLKFWKNLYLRARRKDSGRYQSWLTSTDIVELKSFLWRPPGPVWDNFERLADIWRTDRFQLTLSNFDRTYFCRHSFCSKVFLGSPGFLLCWWLVGFWKAPGRGYLRWYLILKWYLGWYLVIAGPSTTISRMTPNSLELQQLPILIPSRYDFHVRHLINLIVWLMFSAHVSFIVKAIFCHSMVC